MITGALVAITIYAGPYVGQPLFCGGTYTTTATPWVAVPVEWYEEGLVECGDPIAIKTEDAIHVFPARDAIARGWWCVEQPDGSCPRIVADVPAHLSWFDGLSTTGRVWKVEKRHGARQCR